MADIVTSRTFVDGEKGITAQKLNDIVASSVIQPAFYISKPTAGTADPTDIVLILKSGAYAQVPVSTLGGSATQAQIWSTRLRSFNAVGNPNFEVDQRNVGGSAGMTGPVLQIDRWTSLKTGTMTGSVQQIPAASPVVVPGTNFAVSSKYWRVTLAGAQATLGAGDFIQLVQYVEGPQWRELSNDVHSVSLLVRSSVANLSFGLFLKDPATSTKSLTKLCTIPTANVFTLITLPNLPVWPSGNFVVTPGANGYQIGISLAAGSTITSPANDVWQNGNFIGAVGQSNFANNPVNSYFDIAFVQHEPGSVCSTLMDKPFTQNLDECLRYYQKSYDYGTAIGGVTVAGAKMMIVPAGLTTGAVGPLSFHKPMAKVPSMFLYNHATGAANIIRDGAGVDHSAAGATSIGLGGFPSISFGAAVTAGGYMVFHYTADSGW